SGTLTLPTHIIGLPRKHRLGALLTHRHPTFSVWADCHRYINSPRVGARRKKRERESDGWQVGSMHVDGPSEMGTGSLQPVLFKVTTGRRCFVRKPEQQAPLLRNPK
ncbi:MAG: hypothetical protein GY820_03455, partial [Gammaproteobacteria bacterium]|nr:hypothetical protein [Gammaproteobacteria bacterium]